MEFRRAQDLTPPTASAVLSADFFERDTLVVAEQLMGVMLCRQLPSGEVLRLPLTEVEAYDGPEDKACHAHRGKTPRNAVMFGPAGHYYVYLCYGVHWLLNVVTGPVGYPAAVLIRGVGVTHGPGRVTKLLEVNKAQDGQRAVPESGLWFEKAEVSPPQAFERTPRIGIDYAGPIWASKPYRWIVSRESVGRSNSRSRKQSTKR